MGINTGVKNQMQNILHSPIKPSKWAFFKFKFCFILYIYFFYREVTVKEDIFYVRYCSYYYSCTGYFNPTNSTKTGRIAYPFHR